MKIIKMIAQRMRSSIWRIIRKKNHYRNWRLRRIIRLKNNLVMQVSQLKELAKNRLILNTGLLVKWLEMFLVMQISQKVFCHPTYLGRTDIREYHEKLRSRTRLEINNLTLNNRMKWNRRKLTKSGCMSKTCKPRIWFTPMLTHNIYIKKYPKRQLLRKRRKTKTPPIISRWIIISMLVWSSLAIR